MPTNQLSEVVLDQDSDWNLDPRIFKIDILVFITTNVQNRDYLKTNLKYKLTWIFSRYIFQWGIDKLFSYPVFPGENCTDYAMCDLMASTTSFSVKITYKLVLFIYLSVCLFLYLQTWGFSTVMNIMGLSSQIKGKLCCCCCFFF